MKLISLNIFLLINICLLSGCNNPENPEKNIISRPFEHYDKDIVPLKGFVFDTLTESQNKPSYKGYAILPKLENKSDSALEIELRNEIIKAKDGFRNEESALHTTGNKNEIDSFAIRTTPVNVFRNKSTISYCLEMCYTDNHIMRPFCGYVTLNFDVNTRKKILFSDFFTITTSADSLYFKTLILSAVEEKESMYMLSLDDRMDFSFDNDYVYFIFDQYELSAPFNISGGIKKSYIRKFIKKQYW